MERKKKDRNRGEGAAGKGRLSFTRETCALLHKFSFCKPRAVNSIDYWLSMRGLTEIHSRAWTLTGNFLLNLCHFCEFTVFLTHAVLQSQMFGIYMHEDTCVKCLLSLDSTVSDSMEADFAHSIAKAIDRF